VPPPTYYDAATGTRRAQIEKVTTESTDNSAAFWRNVGSSAFTPAPSTRNCAVEYCIAASIGVTDVRVQ
jgi:hypothetical protein